MKARWLTVAAMMVLVAAFAVRLYRLDVFIAADEMRWTCRALSFSDALTRGDFPNTFQTGHPGVLTMWLGSLMVPASQVPQVFDICRKTENAQAPAAATAVEMADLAAVLWRMRVAAALFNASLLIPLYWLARRLLGPLAGLLGLLLLAFDPFLLAHSRVLHLDAILSGLLLLSVLTLLLAFTPHPPTLPHPPTPSPCMGEGEPNSPSPLVGEGVRGWGDSPTSPSPLVGEGARGWGTPIVVSGVLAGIALTQKVSAVFLWPWVGLALFALATRDRWTFSLRRWAGRLQLLRLLPTPSAPDALRATTDLIQLGLVWGVGLVLGVLLVWPAVWANPIGTALGVVAKAADEGGNPHQAGQFVGEEIVDDPGPLMYALALAFRASPWMLLGVGLAVWMLIRRQNTAVLALVGYVVLFALLISLSPKKFDRYLLPIFPTLDLVAGAGLAALIGRVRLPQTIAVMGVLLTQLALCLPHAPYYLTYYNPLLGGGATATHWLLVGWGEGYDQAAAYLNSLPNAQDTQVAVRGVSQFAPVFVGETRSAPGYRAYQTDYVVFYANEVQRRRNEGLLQRYLDNPNEKPVHVVRMHGIDYAWIYPNTTSTQALAYVRQNTQPGDALLVNGASLAAKGAPVGLPQAHIFGHFSPKDTVEALNRLPTSARLWYLRYPEADPGAVLDVLRERVILEGEPRKFPDVEIWQGRILRPATIAIGVESEGLRLVAWGASNYFPIPGQQEALTLAWQVQRAVQGDLTLSLELVDTNDSVVARVDKALRSQDLRPTSKWGRGEQINTLVPFTFPPGAPPGGYVPRLSLRRGDTTLTWVSRPSLVLDPLTVGRMPTPLTLDKFEIGTRFLGDTGLGIQLVGHDLTPQRVAPGATLDVPLWWIVRGSLSPLSLQSSVRDVRGQTGPLTERSLVSPEQANNDWRAGDIYRVISRAVVSPDAPTGPANFELAIRRVDGLPIPFDYHFFKPIWIQGRPLSELPRRPQTAADYEVDGAARLVGYDATQTYSNNPLHVTLYWQVTRPATLPYSTFVHLLKSDGDILTQVDRTAGLGFYPPNAWRPGEIVVDPYSLDLPIPTEPGRYRVALGWYTPAGRATVRDGAGRPVADNRIVLDVDVR